MTPASPVPEAQPSNDVRPVVPTGGSGKLGLIAFVVAMLIGGGWILSVMSEQRDARNQGGPLGVRSDAPSRIASPPPLALPPDFGSSATVRREVLPPATFTATPARTSSPPAPQRVAVEQVPAYSPPQSEAFRPREPSVTFAAPPVSLPPQPALAPEAPEPSRIKASRLERPSRTIPQGTVIPAVLETALDSTRPGGVRALVQRDTYGFDGTRVLIPRGSRLYGEYDAQLQRGENRALIRWTRLIRPDGVTVALDSPASDPLGRAGVKGKVDSKFFQRFGGALLQSVLDIGVGVATREATDGVIVALPGSTQNVTPRLTEGEVRPTIKVRHGTSVSVFVANDLDFSTVEP